MHWPMDSGFEYFAVKSASMHICMCKMKPPHWTGPFWCNRLTKHALFIRSLMQLVSFIYQKIFTRHNEWERTTNRHSKASKFLKKNKSCHGFVVIWHSEMWTHCFHHICELSEYHTNSTKMSESSLNGS